MSKKDKRHASYVQTLLYHDEPQLILLRTDRDLNMLAVAVPHSELQHAYFACEVRDKTFAKYMNGKADLHYAFEDAIRGKYYLFNLSDEDGDIVSLSILPSDEAKNPAYWPLPGSFSRSHTHPHEATAKKSPSTKVYKIDGTWGASDFSHLYGKTANLYAIFGTLDRLDTTTGNNEKAYLRESIASRLWRGGGSYLGFFDDLIERVQGINPLEIERLQYASPGVIVLRGNQSVFNEIDRTIESVGANRVALGARYNNLHGILAKERLLSAQRGARFKNPELAKITLAGSHEFASLMGIPKSEAIYEACERNTVVFCKVMLSIYRRAYDLYLFHAEGRVRSE